MCVLGAGWQEEEEDENKPKAPEPQPHIPYLAPISSANWTATTFSHGGPPVAIARSLQWPGALCAYQVCKGGATGTEMVACIYIGYGHERLQAPFMMEPPPPFEAEPDELVEQTDMPLEEENAIFLAKETERVAAEAAELPDPE